MPNNISVIVTPKLAIVDEKILIEVSGLPPEAPVTIDSFIHHMGHMYLAFGHFFSRHDGTVVPSEQTSYGGSYTGILSMGLFTSMQPLLSKNLGARLIVKGCYQRLLCQTICQRTYLHPSVKRIEVEADHDGAPIRGTLFLPKNHAGPHPGVVDLFGGAAGCLEFRAALLAKAGFATLALGYIAYKDVPYKTFYDVPISYFDQVIDWFLNFPEIQKEGIGMIGVSMGSQMILLCNMRNPKVKDKAVECFHCHEAMGCSTGRCKGDYCVKSVSGQYVSKGCENVKENQAPSNVSMSCAAKQVLNLDITICHCNTEFCNGQSSNRKAEKFKTSVVIIFVLIGLIDLISSDIKFRE